jgi:hypothetical protein
VLNRIGDFLPERKQRVKIKGYASEWINVSSAWSTAGQHILGPLLFILYINHIIENLDCNSYLYADFFKIYSTVTSMRDNVNLQTNLDQVANWSREWLIKLKYF